MSILGTLKGEGVLITDDEEAGVSYSITVTQSGGWKEASGSVDGDVRSIMHAFNRAQSTLRLSSGAEITVIVTQVGTPGGRAMVKVSGPVPGY